MSALNRTRWNVALVTVFVVFGLNPSLLAQNGLRAQRLTNSGQATGNEVANPSSTEEQNPSLEKSLFERISQASQTTEDDSEASFLLSGPEKWTSRKGLSSSLQILILLTVLSLAPAVLLMTTCYVRIIVVLGLLRQALGTGQLPPSQVITSISLFMTLFIMTPVWNEVYTEAIAPIRPKDRQ